MSTFWMVLGFVAQALFSARFLVQWVASERAGRSVVPVVFWHLSIFGTVLLLAYAIYRKDPVFILGQSAGLIVYFRNLFLIWREKRTVSE
ncbi:MAG: lipid-A-disaccharide synthase [Syntrophorhabdus sp. PtaU1.Bin050]|nr:MAG: lipid-A-disaccharide synthase [Syntrophorhabdus sp. PtaU1.Bin050]